MEEACARLKEAGAKRALVLPVSGAFHSPLMEPARAELAKAIEATPFKAPRCPIYQNATAAPTTDPAVIKENALKQLTSPVRWTETVLNMIQDGASHFVEIGPGDVLQGLAKRIISSIPDIAEGDTLSSASLCDPIRANAPERVSPSAIIIEGIQ